MASNLTLAASAGHLAGDEVSGAERGADGQVARGAPIV
jgi:hypothetical protein